MRLRLRLPPSNPVVELNENALFGDLCAKVVELCEGSKADDFSLKTGFPPREILAADSTPLSEVLADGDLVTVHFAANGLSPATANSGAMAVGDSSPGSAMRGAALARPAIRGSNVHTLAAGNSPARHHTSQPSSADVASDSSPGQQGSRKRTRGGGGWKIGGSEEEVSVNLVDIFSKSSGDLNKAQRALKGAFRNAVERREASTLAEQRWLAARTDGSQMQDVSPTKFSVTFAVSERKKVTEEYLALPKPFLSIVLREVYMAGGNSRMNLRPHYMAEAQPLIFWNLIRTFGGDDFVKGLKALMPWVEDWSFYSEDRERILSVKATANREQREKAKKRRLLRKERKMKESGEWKEGTVLEYDPQEYSDSVYSAGSSADERLLVELDSEEEREEQRKAAFKAKRLANKWGGAGHRLGGSSPPSGGRPGLSAVADIEEQKTDAAPLSGEDGGKTQEFENEVSRDCKDGGGVVAVPRAEGEEGSRKNGVADDSDKSWKGVRTS